MSLRLGVLASGSGTNLQSILDACASGALDAEVKLVLCNVEGAGALARADAASVPARCIPHGDFPGRDEFDAALVESLRAHDVEWVVLAGFMRLLTPAFLDAFDGRVTNVHPSLLPAFPGIHAARQALERGVRITGTTIHLVDSGADTGPILAQAAVPVHQDDDEATLTARIQVEEHRLYPAVLQWIAEGRLRSGVGRPHLADLDETGATLVVPHA